jgi:uncharacterized protein (DUF4415 family)
MKKTKVSNRKRKKAILTISDDDYRKQLEEGIPEEFTLRPGRHVFRPARRLASQEETQPRNCKVRVTMFLDADVLAYFKKRAARPDAAPYQTQINATLREVMNRHATGTEGQTAEFDQLLDNRKFIEAVAERVQARSLRRRRRTA